MNVCTVHSAHYRVYHSHGGEKGPGEKTKDELIKRNEKTELLGG